MDLRVRDYLWTIFINNYYNYGDLKNMINFVFTKGFTVYSKETAREMARAISVFASSDYGIGVTGKLGKRDPNNKFGYDNQVFVCIYDSGKYIDFNLFVDRDDRRDDKLEVLEVVVNKLLEYLEK